MADSILRLRINARGTIIYTKREHLDRCRALRVAFNPTTETVELDYRPDVVHQLLDRLAGHPGISPLDQLLSPADLGDPRGALRELVRRQPRDEIKKKQTTFLHLSITYSDGGSRGYLVDDDWYTMMTDEIIEFRTEPKLIKPCRAKRGITTVSISETEAEGFFRVVGLESQQISYEFLMFSRSTLFENGIISRPPTEIP